jgi:hypothetical protein
MSAIEALAAAKAAGVRLTLDAPDGIILETKTPPLPADLVALLKAAKPDLMRILEWREAARAALNAIPPEDCGTTWIATGVRVTAKGKALDGVRENRWAIAMHGLRRFVGEGWGDQACLMGWTKEELYRVPPRWARVDLTGAGLMIDDKKVLAVTEDNIVIAASLGSTLKFRRIGRRHVA